MAGEHVQARRKAVRRGDGRLSHQVSCHGVEYPRIVDGLFIMCDGNDLSSISAPYWDTVRGYDGARLERAMRRAALYRRLRAQRARKTRLSHISLRKTFLLITVFCILLAGPLGGAIRKSVAIVRVRNAVSACVERSVGGLRPTPTCIGFAEPLRRISGRQRLRRLIAPSKPLDAQRPERPSDEITNATRALPIGGPRAEPLNGE